VIESLATSVIVATRTAFTVVDQVEVDGGSVRSYGSRTAAPSCDGRRVHIASSELIDETVTVYTAYEERRSSIDVTVALDTDLDVVDVIVDETLAKVDSVNRVGPIRARSFSEDVDLPIRIWHGPRIPDGSIATDTAVRRLEVAFERAGIRFAPATSMRLGEPPK
jgi:small-conductance mechanosensitive channel